MLVYFKNIYAFSNKLIAKSAILVTENINNNIQQILVSIMNYIITFTCRCVQDNNIKIHHKVSIISFDCHRFLTL